MRLVTPRHFGLLVQGRSNVVVVVKTEHRKSAHHIIHNLNERSQDTIATSPFVNQITTIQLWREGFTA